MPEIQISIESLSESIKGLKPEELESLILSLCDEGEKLLSRKKELQNKKIQTLTRKEVFDVSR